MDVLGVVCSVHHILCEDRCIYFVEWSNNFLYFLLGICGNATNAALTTKLTEKAIFLSPITLRYWPHAVLFHLHFLSYV